MTEDELRKVNELVKRTNAIKHVIAESKSYPEIRLKKEWFTDKEWSSIGVLLFDITKNHDAALALCEFKPYDRLSDYVR